MCPHRERQGHQEGEAPGVRGVREDREYVVTPADLPELRGHAVLRLIAEPPRQQARAGLRPPGRLLGGAGRALVVLLPGRRRRGVLSPRRAATSVRRGTFMLVGRGGVSSGATHPLATGTQGVPAGPTVAPP